MAAKKRCILIDLDGVLNRYDGNFDSENIPEVKEGVRDFLENLVQSFELKLFTTRNRLIASKWLINNNLDKYFTDITNIKEPCFLYIDDRCLQFKGNYDELLKDIHHFDVWWKQR